MERIFGNTFVLFLLLAALYRTAAPAGNENVQEYRMLCQPYELKDQTADSKFDITAAEAKAALEEIEMLNLSTATPSYLENKNGELKPTAEDEKKEAKPAWQKKKQEIGKTGAPGKEPKYKQIEDKRYALIANQQKMRIHTVAAGLVQTLNSKLSTITTKRNEAKQKLKIAATGNPNGEIKPSSMEPSHANQCSGHGGHANVGKTIVAAIICLCTLRNGANNDHCKQGVNVLTLATPQTTGGEQHTALTTNCKSKQQTTDIKPESLTALLNSFYSLLGRDAKTPTAAPSAYILGKTHANGCTGANAQASCVN
uniref:Variant surface glycoprotein 1125.1507 n=1 Tax=Trypanosoma brucei TaxID=5691 RepID=A0A1J0R7C7_9TRYP|nr:variant surface glycoprotein 1125.1507 [Trypanosoma brucei]